MLGAGHYPKTGMRRGGGGPISDFNKVDRYVQSTVPPCSNESSSMQRLLIA